MKKIFAIIVLFIIFSPSIGEVFSANLFGNIEKNEKQEIFQEKYFEKNIEKKNFEKKIEKKIKKNFEKKIDKKNTDVIFQNIPENKKKIIKKILQKFEGKKFFSSLEKISYRENASNRGLASGKKIYFNFDKIDTDEEFKRVMIHEMGHVFDLGYLVSKEEKIVSNFKDGTKKIYADDPSVEFYSLCFSDENTQNGKCGKLDFASKYGQTDPFEDFAESFLLYVEDNNSFKEMTLESENMKKKYDFLKKYIGKIDSGKYFGQEKLKRVRDLTLAY